LFFTFRQVKDLRELNDEVSNKQAEMAKYEQMANKKSVEIQSTIDTTVRPRFLTLRAVENGTTNTGCVV
jgi:uncharacterized protein YlxW (UPF0749 family)